MYFNNTSLLLWIGSYLEHFLTNSNIYTLAKLCHACYAFVYAPQ